MPRPEALGLQERVASLQEDNTKLRKRLDEADEAANLEDDLFFASNALWRKSETAVSAYCTTCWGTKKQLVRLERADDKSGGWCGACREVREHVYRSGERPDHE